MRQVINFINKNWILPIPTTNYKYIVSNSGGNASTLAKWITMAANLSAQKIDDIYYYKEYKIFKKS